MASLRERQENARRIFIDSLNLLNVEVNYKDREIIIKQDDKEFPYIVLECAALTDAQGKERLEEIEHRMSI